MTEGHLGLRKFSGTTDVKEFIKRFKLAAKAKDLTADQSAAWIPIFLTGPAMSFYDTLSDATKLKDDEVLQELETQSMGLENSHFQLQGMHTMMQRE